ncbi:hypothetical protein ACFP1Z_00060 [Streptomyces gamaensis]|uniref:Uncharacterized protein n=1 Tax=Streptomyces gamaensis TaxID=1763542 RepID=A0ABW0YWS7_9ACTN
METFNYPNAEKILGEKKIALRKGDGHIVLADCRASTDIRVWTTQSADGSFCFKVTGDGKSGYLSMEIPKVYYIQTGDYAVKADVVSEGVTKTVNMGKEGEAYVGVGANPPGKEASLIELRVMG